MVGDNMLMLYLALLNDSDKDLFERIYYAYRKQMLMVAKSVLHNDTDAEDAVHDVFLKVATKYMSIVKAIESDIDIRNYLLKAIKNTALNLKKKKNIENVSLNTIKEYNMAKQGITTDDEFVEIIFQKCEYERVVKAIQELNEKYRYVLYYHFVIGLTAAEIAKSLEQSLSATKKQLVRGKKMLLDLLGVSRSGE